MPKDNMLQGSEYAYAKACGIIGKSFLGKKRNILSTLHTLGELDRIVFQDNARELPARELTREFEGRLAQRAIAQILSVVKSYASTPLLLSQMIRAYEYSDLKVCIAHIAAGKKEKPFICDIGRFQTVRFDLFPDIDAMLHGTEFSKLIPEIKEIRGADTTEIETKLDFLYYKGLTESLSEIHGDDLQVAKRLVASEISLRNCVWALRLRSYYNKTEDDVARFLMDFNLDGISLAKDAKKSLGWSLDSRVQWKEWKWEKLLNREDSSLLWTADPRYFQNAASLYLYALAKRSLHLIPQEISSIFCFIKLKQYEEDFLTSLAEGLALGIESSEIFRLLEVH